MMENICILFGEKHIFISIQILHKFSRICFSRFHIFFLIENPHIMYKMEELRPVCMITQHNFDDFLCDKCSLPDEE